MMHNMYLNFTKMHGLGNDFVVLNNLEGTINLSEEQIRHITDRHTGIGCDQLIILEASDKPAVDVKYRIFNTDGSEASQCGNGARCIGRYLIDKDIINKKTIVAETIKEMVSIHVQDNGDIRVNMGSPRFEPEDIPILAAKKQQIYQLTLSDIEVSFYSLSIPNPHAIIIVDDVKQAKVHSWGEQIQNSEIFPDSVNVGFMQILDPNHIKLRVYERGVGETLACGTGACAAVVAGITSNKLENEVEVGLKRGNLVIYWGGGDEQVWMTGPATTVYQGQIQL
jgi:diaminopimelate epimerase